MIVVVTVTPMLMKPNSRIKTMFLGVKFKSSLCYKAL